MPTACAAVATISEARFLELLQAPGELRSEEMDAVCAKLSEMWYLHLSSTSEEIKLWKQVCLLDGAGVRPWWELRAPRCSRCRYSKLGCVNCNPEERRTKFRKVRAACSNGEAGQQQKVADAAVTDEV